VNGRWHAQRFLVLRRLSQLAVLALFLIGPLAGIWLIKGNMSSSLLLGTVPLTDPFVLLQSLFAGHWPAATALLGALIVLIGYWVVGGRAYCSWVCPINAVTDAAYWAQRRLGLKPVLQLSRNMRFGLLALVPLLALVTGILAWELINPVSILFRAVVFGVGLAWAMVLGLFLFDLALARRGWCSHLCPMGAFYAVVGATSPLRIRADNRAACDDCMDCFAVCPEPQVIRPALKGAPDGVGPVITSGQCTNCGRCIDVCAKNVFRFGPRWPVKNPKFPLEREVTP
jgi:ferredoxin-type protein NapH